MSGHPKQYHFFVDRKKYETEQESITGADIKRLANVNPAHQLFVEEKGDAADRLVSDSEGFDLANKTWHFYTVPPATFGAK